LGEIYNKKGDKEKLRMQIKKLKELGKDALARELEVCFEE